MNKFNESKLLVAIVDDEVDITGFLAAALEDSGYRVVEINESGSALTSLRADPPDLICLDLLMPQRTGASLYKEILDDPLLKSTPVLILSGLGPTEDLNEILVRNGALAPPAGYVEKPIEPEPFLALVHELLDRKNAGPESETQPAPKDHSS